MRTRITAHQQLYIAVQLHDMDLERVGAHVLAEGPEIVNDSLHLYRTLAHARWRYQLRLHSCEPREVKLVRFVTIAPLTFLFWHGILASGHRKAIDLRDQIFRWQINHTLARTNEIVGGLSHLAQAKHATPTQPPRR